MNQHHHHNNNNDDTLSLSLTVALRCGAGRFRKKKTPRKGEKSCVQEFTRKDENQTIVQAGRQNGAAHALKRAARTQFAFLLVPWAYNARASLDGFAR